MAGDLEPVLHERFASFRITGEWSDLGVADPLASVRLALDEIDIEGRIRRGHEERFNKLTLDRTTTRQERDDACRDVDALRSRVQQCEQQLANLQQQIATERAIPAKEKEMSDLAIYTQAQGELPATEVLCSINGSTRCLCPLRPFWSTVPQ